jgi:phospholipase/carboxylesterase
MGKRVTRRAFGITAGGTIASLVLGGKRVALAQSDDARQGRFTARPRATGTTTLTNGPLGLSTTGRDGVVQMPATKRDGSIPLLVFLHGASQDGAAMLRRVGPAADAAGICVVAPDSRNGTWDAIRGGFGEDVLFLNQVLEHVFARFPVDPARVVLGGFSDGASYALSLGLANGDIFPRILACSPGFVVPAAVHGRPRFFVSHGTADQVLPINECSRVIVPQLRSMAYDVTFREFEGRHELPPDIAAEAMRWIAA